MRQDKTGNRQLKVLFLTAAVAPGPRAAPFGAARVASALKTASDLAQRTSIHILEAHAGESPRALADRALAERADIVGLSLYLWNSRLLEDAAALIKADAPRTVIVAGGPEASADPSRLSALAFIDCTVAGEGEKAMADIVRAVLEGKTLPGPVILPPPVDLSALPSPWMDGTLQAERWNGAALELMRGCPYHCAFCFESKGVARLRRFPLELVAKEIARFEESRKGGGGVDEVFVLDPTFNADAKRMAEAIRIFSRHGSSLRYFVELRAELLTAEQARLLSTIDASVQIGLQSSDPAVLKLVDRDFEPESFARKVRLLEAEGILYGLDLIYGLPGDTLAGFRRSLDYAVDLGPNHLDIFRLAVLPGTTLYDRAGSLKLDCDPSAPYLVRSTPDFSVPELNEAERLAIATDVLYNRGRAVMWLRPVLQLARMRPSALFSQFANFLGERKNGAATWSGTELASHQPEPASHLAIEKLQIEFFTGLFAAEPPAGKGAAGKAAAGSLAPGTAAASKPAAVQAALDLIRVSGAWTRALAEGESSTLEIGWDPEALLDEASAGIADFAAAQKPHPARWTYRMTAEGPSFRQGHGSKPKRM
jgi:hypothetical protein